MFKPRQYQADGIFEINHLWQSVKNVLYVLPTGGGKTFTFSRIIHEHNGASCAIAHRQELVSQISLALARDGVRHKIIGPRNVIKLIVSKHMEEIGQSYYDPNSHCAVAGVDTLIRRYDELKSWLRTVTLWVQDECHHVLEDNKWGAAAKMFPNAKGLGVTATPLRADGKGLGRHHDGLFDTMVIGPSMRDLINDGYLTDYRIFAPQSDLILDNITISKTTGDYNPNQLKSAVRKSHIIGDVVSHYLRIAPGKLGITFATDVETATDIAQRFNNAGVPAAVVSAKTDDKERDRILRNFKQRKLLQLVNVDLFGEGFDLPAIEVVSMARPTQSYGLYVQQFGRGLRIMEGKTTAIIIDHVGNVVRHGLPDAPRIWSLDRRDKKSSNRLLDVIPVKTCLNEECLAVYERIYKACPYCGHKPEINGRASPEQVDGDLTELDPATLAKMRGEIRKSTMSIEEYKEYLIFKGCPPIGLQSNIQNHKKRLAAINDIRNVISLWGGYQRSMNRPDSESYRLFYLKFGVDVLTAQMLKTQETIELNERIQNDIRSMGGKMERTV